MFDKFECFVLNVIYIGTYMYFTSIAGANSSLLSNALVNMAGNGNFAKMLHYMMVDA